jgi:FMN phosphatase YigB (HAD superfamily)
MSAGIRAVTLDVGGTLWPNSWPDQQHAEAERRRRLVAAVPALRRSIDPFMAELRSWEETQEGELTQDTVGTLVDIASRLGVSASDEVADRMRRALALPIEGHSTPFAGFRALFDTIAQLKLQCILLTNTLVGNAEDRWRDLRSVGVEGFVDDVITSADVGWRKPERRIFERAIASAACPPEAIVHVGNSEHYDVDGAAAVGMRTILVAIEDPIPEHTRADALATSLGRVAAILSDWTLSPADSC